MRSPCAINLFVKYSSIPAFATPVVAFCKARDHRSRFIQVRGHPAEDLEQLRKIVAGFSICNFVQLPFAKASEVEDSIYPVAPGLAALRHGTTHVVPGVPPHGCAKCSEGSLRS
jgi:hypothetical protein